MDEQAMNTYLELYVGVLKQVRAEVKTLYAKQEEINKREKDILTIKENTAEILKLLQKQQKIS